MAARASLAPRLHPAVLEAFYQHEALPDYEQRHMLALQLDLPPPGRVGPR